VLEFEFHQGGIFLPKINLWLDAHEPRTGPERVFISHAHSDHIESHREVILSAPTARLMQARLPGARLERILQFHQQTAFEQEGAEYSITLLPAGHIFGSAMALIRSGTESLLYTGDFKLRSGLSAEPCEPQPADVLIMETTYGRPQYRFPPTAEVIAGIIRFCKQALDNDETPVLLGYSLGKSQELLCSLGDAHLPIMLHGTVYKLTRIYEQFGHCFPPYAAYESGKANGHVLLCPPSVAGSAMLRKLGRTRLAMLTGWAVDSNCRYRYGADAAFPLSDHADFPDLVEMVNKVRPRRIYTLHGFAADFAQHLRELGFDAQALSEEEQMNLQLESGCPPRKEAKRSIPASNISNESFAASGAADSLPFEQFSETSFAIASTSSKLQKVALLADYLRGIPGELLSAVVTWFTGTPFASSENKVMQLGWATIREALCAVGGISPEDFHHVYLKHSDLGETAFEILQHAAGHTRFSKLSLQQIRDAFARLQAARGPGAKLPLLVGLLQNCSALEAKFIVKILTSDLRIGLKEGLVEEAIARAFSVSVDEVRKANLLLGNAGETAVLASQQRLGAASIIPFRPVKFMLASPEPTAADVWGRMRSLAAERAQTAPNGAANTNGSSSAAPPVVLRLEDKYDGIRCQLHKTAERVALYSRDLKEISDSFPEITSAARKLSHDVILDGEILAMRGDEILPFSVLQRRLGRREPDLFMQEEFPIRFVAFDLLWIDGLTLLNEPLSLRWAKLLALQPLPAQFRFVEVSLAS